MKSITAIASTIGLIAALAPPSYGQRFTTLYTITGDNPIGLTRANGAIYGTTFAYSGPAFNCGTVYELQPPTAKGGAWAVTVLYSFPNVPGGACDPFGAPVVAADGTLYGLTGGQLYEVQPPASPGAPWTASVLYSFGAPGTGILFPVSGLVNGPDGSFYVLTAGGANGTGALCQLQPPASGGTTWTATLLYSFPAGSPTGPLNSLTQGPDGVLYGTGYGGPDWGQVFQLTPPGTPGGAWTNTALYTFVKAKHAAGNPIALTIAPDGTLYGTAYGYHPPGASGASGAFRLAPPAAPGGRWGYTLLTAPLYMEHLNTPLVAANGNLYGGITTGNGGSIFELQPPPASGGGWTMTTVHTFTNEVPIGNLVVGPNGTIYGTTAAAPGQPSGGTVYAIITK